MSLLNKFIFTVFYSSAALYAETQNVSTGLTAYKDGGLIQQKHSLPLAKEKALKEFHDLAHSIISDSLVVTLSAAAKDATIDEISLHKNTDDTSHSMHALLNSNIQDPNNTLYMTYLFKNISWKTQYAIEFSPDYKQVQFNGWIHVTNNAGIPFNDTTIQFIDDTLPLTGTAQNKKKQKKYVFKDKISLPKNGSKRLTWISSDLMNVKRDYRVFVGGDYLNDMEGQIKHPPIETWVSFKNSVLNTRGKQLPAGSTILYYKNQNGHLEAIGNTEIPHTETDQEISVRIPPSQIDFTSQTPITAGRSQEIRHIETELEQNQFRRLSDTQNTDAHYKLELRNNNKEAATIRVVLKLPEKTTNWEIIRQTIQHEPTTNNTVYWNVKIPANGQVTLKYHLRYTTA